MHQMTQQNLHNAFAGESQAHMKYMIFADKARKEGKPNIARLFTAIAYAEQVHATAHLKALEEIGDTVRNLDTAIEGETFEADEMYPVYHTDAKFQEEKAAEKSTFYAMEAERIHAAMYGKARDAAAAGQDIALKEVFICPVCGYTVEGEAEDQCPVCGVRKALFKKF